MFVVFRIRLFFPVAKSLLVGLSILLCGCASVNGPANSKDPWESYNRTMFGFNEKVDKAIIKPVATGYRNHVPQPVRTGIKNVYNNLDDVVVVANDVLQFKFGQAMSDLSRLVYNTVFGLFGIFDVATWMGLPKHKEDFGQTLAVWGVGNGPYLVLPFLPPGTIRDTTGLFVDFQIDPVFQIEDDLTRYAAIYIDVIDRRAQLLSATRILDEAALDRYAFVRDAYFQQRRNLIYDGNPPEEKRDQLETEADRELELELELELERQLKTNP